MIAEIILIPDGMGMDAAKASAQYVARGLASIGMKVREHISVCPDAAQFQQAVATALSRSNILITLGGMSKDSGFLAKTILSRGLSLPLEENSTAIAGIREYCRRTAEPFEPGDSALAMLPRGATAFPGTYGKLPGCAIASAKQHIIMLPESQAEIAPMFNKYVTPYLGGSSSATVTRTLRTYGVKDTAVCDVLGDLMNSANPAVTVQREDNEVLVRVAAHAETSQQAAALCTPVLRTIVERLGDSAYGLDVSSLQSAVVNKLERKNLDIAIAEGGTGGMLTRVMSETPGGQDILRYSVSVDTLEAKEQRLGIKQKLLKKCGNVSEYAAVAAASAAREKAKTKLGISVLANTGGEKSRGCPLGVVYIAVCGADNVYVKKLVVGNGDADADVITDAALSRALNMTRLVADYAPVPYTASIPLSEALDGFSVTELQEYEEDVGKSGPDDKVSSFWGRFFGNFVVRKSDKRGVKVRKFIFILAMIVFLTSAGYVGWHFYSGYAARKQAEQLQNMFAFGEMDDVTVSPDYPKNYSLKFAGLWNINPDVIAFISIPDTGVKYPIVKAADNDYYLRRDFYGKSNKYGVPFMDYRVDVKKPSDNIVVYGHNMMDGQIFGELTEYKKLDYYKLHPAIDFTTVYHENTYKIFSVFITNAYENQGEVFAYHDFIDAKSGDDLLRFVNEVSKRSLIKTPVDVQKGDELLTLSTCTYEFKDARLVIVARAVRKGESPDVAVDEADLNPAPLMPDIWYRTFGGTKPVGESVPEVVTSPAVNRDPSSVLESVSELSSARSSSASSSSSEDANVAASKAAASKAASDAAASKAASDAAASKAASDAAAASKAASDAAASKAASDAAASKAASDAAEASKAASDAAESSRLEEEMRKAAEEEDSDWFDKDDGISPKTQASLRVSNSSGSTITVNVSGKVYKDADELDIISRLVQHEIGGNFHPEAIKAQAVAAYSFIKNANASGSTPYVSLASSADQKVISAASEVLGEAIYYGKSIAYTPYHSTSAGQTTSSAAVWGGSYPYLVSVDSSVDTQAPNYKVQTSMSKSKVEDLILKKLGITTSGSPSTWFEVLTYEDGDYNGKMSVCGETKSQLTGSTITGRLLRESVLGLRSACFETDYDSKSGNFIFTTYGYGHGVGMSQNGANLLAKDGWSYIEILEHYYSGTTVK